jgi:hypothetical protein
MISGISMTARMTAPLRGVESLPLDFEDFRQTGHRASSLDD